MRVPRSLAHLALALSVVACDRATILEPEPRVRAPTIDAAGNAVGRLTVRVSDVEQLYAAVNDPANEGATIVLAPGTYVLSAQTPEGIDRPNAGRLELQPDMSLSGKRGDRSAVVIDMSRLPAASFNAPLGKTSALRVGRGTNALEWMTILGNPNSAAGVETDLVGARPAVARIAHVAAHESIRGVDVRNVGAAMSGRHIVARIEESEFYRGAQGVRVTNTSGVAGGQIDVTMSGNQSHDNASGCLIAHHLSSGGTIHVRSTGDRFEHNGLGCLVSGGLVTSSGAANSNATIFQAIGSAFSNNTLTQFINTGNVPVVDFGGVIVVGAETPGAANSASNNLVSVALRGTTVSGNQNVDFQAFGARSMASPPGIAGTNNHVRIAQYGVRQHLDVVAVNSVPVDPTGTNTVTIVHARDHRVRRGGTLSIDRTDHP
jgi:hypothetical protein